MKHSRILVLLGGALLGSAATVAVLVLSANKPAGVVAAATASQPEIRISEKRNEFRGSFQGAQPAAAADPKPSDQTTAQPVTATSSRTEVTALPGNPAQPALAAPAPSSRPPASSAVPAAQTGHVASMAAPQQVSGTQSAAGSISSGSVPASSVSSVSAPMPGSFSSATVAGSDALTIGPTDVVPAALAPPNPAANLTPQQQALADQMGQQFLQAATTGSPAAAGSSPALAINTAPSGNAINQQTWSQNQKLSDAMYKLYFGYQAYNVQSANAYRQSLQNSGH